MTCCFLGPVAVHPTHQGEGLGALLINESLAEARRLGWERVMLVGDAPYYARFGFRKLEGVEMPPPTNPDRVLGLELKAGAWDGGDGHGHESDLRGLRGGRGPHISPMDQMLPALVTSDVQAARLRFLPGATTARTGR